MSDMDVHESFGQGEKTLGPGAFPRLFRQPTKQASASHQIEIWAQWNEQAAQFARDVQETGSTLFQNPDWLAIWYETFLADPANKALMIALKNRQSGQIDMLLPLCQRKENGLSTISFADFGLCDYNAPLLRAGFAPDAQQTKQWLREICQALPRADLLKLEKMPRQIKGRPNPLAALPGIQTGTLSHFGIEITGSWQDYWSGLKNSFRKDQRRRWRVLAKKGHVRFELCHDAKRALWLFDRLLQQQKARLDHLGLPYLLDDPHMQSFYRQLIQQGCSRRKDGETAVLFSALLVEDEPVATLCGLGDGRHYAMTLSGYEGGEWRKASPGRLLTERTMQHLHAQGYSYFDFTIGDEPYKNLFAKEQGQLLDFTRPLSAKALPYHLWQKVKACYRQSPFLCTLRQKAIAAGYTLRT